MTKSTDNTGRSWVTAAIGGGVVGILLLVVGSGLLVALITGLVIFAIGLMLLPRRGATKSAMTGEVSKPAAPIQPQTAATPEPVVAEEQPASEATPTPTPTPTGAQEQPSLTASALIKTSKALTGPVELAARKGTWRFENNSASA